MKQKKIPHSFEDLKPCCFSIFVTNIENDNTILTGNERSFVELISNVAGEEKLSKRRAHTLVRSCTLLATPVMQEWLTRGASLSRDLWLAEKLFPVLEYVLKGTMACNHVKKFLYESFINVAEFYPLTIKTIYTEIYIRNRISKKVSEEKKKLEEFYNKLRQW